MRKTIQDLKTIQEKINKQYEHKKIQDKTKNLNKPIRKCRKKTLQAYWIKQNNQDLEITRALSHTSKNMKKKMEANK